jgi:RHS repeat-associated protein
MNVRKQTQDSNGIYFLSFTSFATGSGLETATRAASAFNNNLPFALASTANDVGTIPFAYLNYLVLNEQFVAVDGGARRVPEAAGFDPGYEALAKHAKVEFLPITITTKGYVYIWVSNESEATKVWFDDLSVTHNLDIVTQATDYGPWGDVVREQKTNELDIYRYAYQGQYAEKDEETGWEHFELREYDAVIGRSHVKDPYKQFWSSYMWVGNNPVSGIDPTGGICPTCPGGSDYDKYRNSIDPYGFDKDVGIYNDYNIEIIGDRFNQSFFDFGHNQDFGNWGTQFSGDLGAHNWYNENGNAGLPIPAAVSMGASASFLRGSFEDRFGPKKINATVGANGSIASANANLDFGVFSGESGIRGARLDANLGGYVAKGELVGGRYFRWCKDKRYYRRFSLLCSWGCYWRNIHGFRLHYN